MSRIPRQRSEKDVQTAVKRLLRLKGIPYWDTSQPRASMITPGLSDLIALPVGGPPWFIEVKRADGAGHQTPAQRIFQAAAEAAQAVYVVVQSAAELAVLLEAKR